MGDEAEAMIEAVESTWRATASGHVLLHTNKVRLAHDFARMRRDRVAAGMKTDPVRRRRA